MKHTLTGKVAKSFLLGSLLALATLSMQGCNDQAKAQNVKVERALKSNCQMKKCGDGMKCKSGKCGDAKKAAKCGDAKKAAPAMKCAPGKCASGKCGQGK